MTLCNQKQSPNKKQFLIFFSHKMSIHTFYSRHPFFSHLLSDGVCHSSPNRLSYVINQLNNINHIHPHIKSITQQLKESYEYFYTDDTPLRLNDSYIERYLNQHEVIPMFIRTKHHQMSYLLNKKTNNNYDIYFNVSEVPLFGCFINEHSPDLAFVNNTMLVRQVPLHVVLYLIRMGSFFSHFRNATHVMQYIVHNMLYEHDLKVEPIVFQITPLQKANACTLHCTLLLIQQMCQLLGTPLIQSQINDLYLSVIDKLTHNLIQDLPQYCSLDDNITKDLYLFQQLYNLFCTLAANCEYNYQNIYKQLRTLRKYYTKCVHHSLAELGENFEKTNQWMHKTIMLKGDKCSTFMKIPNPEETSITFMVCMEKKQNYYVFYKMISKDNRLHWCIELKKCLVTNDFIQMTNKRIRELTPPCCYQLNFQCCDQQMSLQHYQLIKLYIWNVLMDLKLQCTNKIEELPHDEDHCLMDYVLFGKIANRKKWCLKKWFHQKNKMKKLGYIVSLDDLLMRIEKLNFMEHSERILQFEHWLTQDKLCAKKNNRLNLFF